MENCGRGRGRVFVLTAEIRRESESLLKWFPPPSPSSDLNSFLFFRFYPRFCLDSLFFGFFRCFFLFYCRVSFVLWTKEDLDGRIGSRWKVKKIFLRSKIYSFQIVFFDLLINTSWELNNFQIKLRKFLAKSSLLFPFIEINFTLTGQYPTNLIT